MATFSTREFESLNARLDSGIQKTVIDAAVDVWQRTNTPETRYLLAKSAVRATAYKGESNRSFGARVRRSHGQVGNYINGWKIAQDCVEDETIEPDVDSVAHATTIVGNCVKKDKDAWLETMPTERADRRAWLLASDYTALVPEVEVEVTEDETEPEVTEDETVIEADDNGFEGQLQVLRTLAGRIESGDFTVKEAVALANAAKAIVASAETFATGTIRTAVAA